MMTLSQFCEFLGWASLINIAYLLLATVLIVFMREKMAAIHSKLFKVNNEELDTKYFDFLSHYKIVTLVFFVAPYLSLKIMGH
jgi:hypothetical protein